MLVVNLEQARELDGQLEQWAYNALDVTGTREISDNLSLELKDSPAASRVYSFERSLQAPAFSMMMRGVRIDRVKREALIKEAKQELKRADRTINKAPLVTDVWDGTELETGWCPNAIGKHHKWPRGIPEAERRCERCNEPRVKRTTFNANSPDATYHLLYDLHHLDPLTNKQGKESTDDDVLQRLAHKYPKFRALIQDILVIRDKKKQLGSLLARLGSDNRYYSSFNVGTAWTGRFSSSKNPFGWGGNLQNVAPKHRAMFIADPGMELGYADLKQAESLVTAYLAGDEKYIEAHLLGDTHTYVARLVWPELPWTGDLRKDKKIANQNPPWDLAEGHTYRFHSKSVQHGSNFGRTPFGIAMGMHIPVEQAKRAQENYFTEFDGIPAWQDDMARRVHDREWITNPFGRSIRLTGRPWDKHTWRQALDYIPQSTVADALDLAMWYVWYDLEEQEVQLLAQVHDALFHQFPKGRLDLEREVLKRMMFPIPVTDFRGKTRLMTIGVESATGHNWGHKSGANLHGIDEGPIERYLHEFPL